MPARRPTPAAFLRHQSARSLTHRCLCGAEIAFEAATCADCAALGPEFIPPPGYLTVTRDPGLRECACRSGPAVFSPPGTDGPCPYCREAGRLPALPRPGHHRGPQDPEPPPPYRLPRPYWLRS